MSEYKFICKDGEVMLREPDIMKWRHVFSGLNLDDELNRISLESALHPWMLKKSWFFQLSGYLAKIEKGDRPMAYEKNGQGVLFKNTKTKDTQPDYRGNIEFKGGIPYELSAWIKTAKNGSKYLSLSVGDVAKDRPARLPEHPKDNASSGSPEFDDVPF